MNTYAKKIKKKLLESIDDLVKIATLFTRNPGKDFTRNRKLTMKQTIEMILSFGGNSLNKELLEFYNYSENTVTASAFVQQRDKIFSEAFAFLLKDFTMKLDNLKTFHGFRILAIDGSDIAIPTNANDLDSFVPVKNGRGYNLYHFNALYDISNKLYLDAVNQPNKEKNEFLAAIKMIDRNDIIEPVILTLDRGYNSYNLMAHAESKGWYYLIRTHGPHKKRCILSSHKLEHNKEFDEQLSIKLTRCQTKEIKADKSYRFLARTSNFDYLPIKSKGCYPLNFRAVCVEVEKGNFQYFLTNLPVEEASHSMIGTLYHMRWGIEVSFRELKHTLGLLSFHSKKVEHIKQEIFARMILYNFCEIITLNIIIKQKNRTLEYQVNFTMAIHICKKFLCSSKNARPPNVEALIQKYILPVKKNRKYPRKVKPRSYVSFLYRVA